MALTYSSMLPLGTLMPEFSLLDVVSTTTITSATLAPAPAYLLQVICNHCPYVIHVRSAMCAFAARAQGHGIQVFAICANDAKAYPEDSPTGMREMAKSAGFTFPYLHDEKQELVRKLHAVCTPEFYFFDAHRKLVYRGQMDDSRPRNQEPNNAYCLEAAMQAILRGEALSSEQRPSVGCSIKWLPS